MENGPFACYLKKKKGGIKRKERETSRGRRIEKTPKGRDYIWYQSHLREDGCANYQKEV